MKFKSRLFVLLLTMILVLTGIPTTTMKVHAAGTPAAYPVAYDKNGEWVKYLRNNYPKARNQGDEGLCTVFATIACAEMYAFTHGWVDKNVDYSEAHLAYWTRHKLPNTAIKNNDTISTKTNVSYNINELVDTFKHGVGPVNESVAPYFVSGFAINSIVNGSGTLPDSTAFASDITLSRCYTVRTMNDIKNAIKTNGAVEAGIKFNSDLEAIYGNGSCYYVPANVSVDNQHSVAIVGWDDNFPKNNFKYKPSRNGAWLVRNSWNMAGSTNGTTKDYFWLSYDTDINNANVLEFTKKTYNKNYSYSSISTGTRTVYSYRDALPTKYANVYTATDNETLKAVSFTLDSFTYNTNLKYTISIYTNIKNANNPTSGNLVYQTSQSVNFTSNHDTSKYLLINTNDITLKPGQMFSVVIDAPKLVVNAEFGSFSNSDNAFTHTAELCQSYTYNGSSWSDFSKKENTNLAIDVYTKTSNNHYNGLVLIDKTWAYVSNGLIDSSKTGFVDYDGGKFYVKNGYVDTSANGAIKDPNSSKQYFVSNGQVCTNTSGLALYQVTWYYLNKGVIDTSFTGITSYNGAQFYVVSGKLASYYTGKVTYNGRTYNVVYGQVY